MIRAWLLAGGGALCAAPLWGQARLAAGAHGVVLATRAAPMPRHATVTEVRLVQPMAMLASRVGPLALLAVADFEGLTMPGGQLAPGSWGEGFNDRRHPHTYAHELMAALHAQPGAGLAVSLAAGKGFAPFGTDDPMNRPALLYPVNHHWSQILERAVLIGAVARGPLTLEAGLMNGDEPERPSSWPLLKGRFGDSWALRALARPVPQVELQLSRARVRSPEHRVPPAGPRHEKWSASVRYERATPAGRDYALVEWARTSELEGTFVYVSLLAEAELARGRHRPYLRVERTERPEEQRLLDPFRSQRPHFENANLGISRWLVLTAGYGFTMGRWGPLALEPVAECGVAHVTMVTSGAVFTPEDHFGGNDLVTLNVGLRIGAGARMHRMGRYGVLAQPGMARNRHHQAR